MSRQVRRLDDVAILMYMTRQPSDATQPVRRHRAPSPEERQVDAEHSKAALIEAALEEFSAKGFGGARVRDIAKRAGVSKDLITYHFGGKEGLYAAVQEAWKEHKDSFVDASLPLSENLARYLHEILSDPRLLRMAIWRGLALGADAPSVIDDDAYPSVAVLLRRQEHGEIDPQLDPALVQLVLLGVVAAPIVFPERVRSLFGVDVTDPLFEERYRSGLLQLLCVSAPVAGDDSQAS
jgi:AcrR family transcriptional regulator